MTDLGPLDVLGAIEGGRDFDDLVGTSTSIEVGGHRVRVLGIQMLTELKRDATTAKDKLTLAVLEETLRRLAGGK